jgi:hypothetical protein
MLMKRSQSANSTSREWIVCSIPGDETRGTPTVYGVVSRTHRLAVGLTDRDFESAADAASAIRKFELSPSPSC